jgi:hypothetical protein
MMMEMACNSEADYRCKTDFARLSRRLWDMAQDLRGLSDAQPDYSERLKIIQTELNSLACRLRRERA